MGRVAAIVMAAGKGTRMKSKLPKVLHQIGGKPLIAHVINSLQNAGIDDITVVVGHGSDLVQQALGNSVKYAMQAEQLGTGHAVLQAKDIVDHNKDILVVSGDTPLLSSQTIKGMITQHSACRPAITLLTAVLDNPYGYGRIIRDESGRIGAIREEKDATIEERAIREINTGTYCFAGDFLFASLQQLKNDNAQNEYYLTDLISLAAGSNAPVVNVNCIDVREIQGINSRAQLAEVTKIMNMLKIEQLMADGVTIVDPGTTYIDSDVEVGTDTIILPFTFLLGQTQIGEDCSIGPQTRVVDSCIGNRVSIENSITKNAVVGDDCTVGPFAYLRPETVLASGVKVGDFVEIKKSYIGQGSKVPHLSYIGDTKIGKTVNIGAGTITCNYDGKNKHITEIDDGAFIGSNTNLVAPVHVGQKAVIAAGSTLTKDVPPGSLGVARGKQVNVPNWTVRLHNK